MTGHLIAEVATLATQPAIASLSLAFLLQAFALHALEPMPHSLPKQANRAFGTTEPFTDLPGRVALQAHFEDGTFVLVQVGEKLTDRFAEYGCLERRRLATQGVQPCRRLIGSRRLHFSRGVSALGMVVYGPLGALPHGNQREQAPEVVPAGDVQVFSAIAEKETLVRRLDHVFGIDLVPQSNFDMPQREGVEPAGKSPKELLRRGVVLIVQLGQEPSEGIRHGWRPLRFGVSGQDARRFLNSLPIPAATGIHSVEDWRDKEKGATADSLRM
jgi:hypothetical protein